MGWIRTALEARMRFVLAVMEGSRVFLRAMPDIDDARAGTRGVVVKRVVKKTPVDMALVAQTACIVRAKFAQSSVLHRETTQVLDPLVWH